MENRVRLTIDDGVAHVRLNRPDKMNALDPAMFEAIIEAGSKLAKRSDVHAVVLSGEGRAFCAGLDLDRLLVTTTGESLIPSVDLTRRTHGLANYAQHLVWLWRELPVPVLAAVHGVAFGAASNSRSAPISAISRPTRSSQSSRRNGGWCRIWAARNSCAVSRARMSCAN